MLKKTERKILDILAENKYVTKDEILNDKDFIKDLARAVEVARAAEISKDRERSLEEFTEKELEMEKSPEPWCDVMVVGVDPVRGVAIRTGWNSAFIKYLKENGFSGDSEEAIVQHWIGRLGLDTVLEDYYD